MTTRALYVATRKGVFKLQRTDGHGNHWHIVATAFLGRHASAIKYEAQTETTFVALSNGRSGVEIHRTGNGWSRWQLCACPEYPQTIPNTASQPTTQYVWTLETSRNGWRLWCGTVPGGLFMSNDAGDTWPLVDSLWERDERKDWVGGGFDSPGIHSICVHPQNDDHITIGVSCGGVWVTEDAGNTWDSRIAGFDVNLNNQNPHRVVQCRATPDHFWVQHHGGVYRSRDCTHTWEKVDSIEPSSFGFAVSVHPAEPHTAWFVPVHTPEKRMPVNGRLVVARTTNGGQTFDILDRGLPDEHAYHLTLRHALDVDDDGTTLAFGTTTGSLWTSDNAGDNWYLVTSDLPPIHAVHFA